MYEQTVYDLYSVIKPAAYYLDWYACILAWNIACKSVFLNSCRNKAGIQKYALKEMNIAKETIYKVADLARIEIAEQEVETLQADMNKILTFMEKLNELDTKDVEPLVYMNPEVNVWREDVVHQDITVSEGLKNSALHNEDFFLVPKILDK